MPFDPKIFDATSTTFYSAMSNVDVEIGAGNPAAAAIRFRVAQHAFLSHMDASGWLYFADRHDQRIYRWSPERRSGSYLKRRPSARLADHMPLDALPAALGAYEVRFVLEARAASLAAVRRSSEEFAALEEACAVLRTALLALGPAHEEDMAFHRAIVLATGNAVFVSVFDHMRGDIDRIMRAGVDISRNRPADAIGAQDADAAALAMRWHLSQGRKRLMP